MTEDEVEAVAQALYEAQDCARGWRWEPELLKARFRRDARLAIAAIDKANGLAPEAEIGPLILAAEVESAREILMSSEEVGVMPISGFRAVLRGPDHIFDAANHLYFRLVGVRDLCGVPVRDALPELTGQGYFELLDQVYESKKPFIGSMLPITFQPTPGAPSEQHIIDFAYRTIHDPSGNVMGIFVEGYDRTELARA